MVIPAKIRERLISVLGEPAKEWLEAAPSLVRDLSAPFSFEADGRIWGNYSVVLPGFSAGEPAVLKLVPPSWLISRELEALSTFDGAAAVRVLGFDSDRGAILMERAEPGEELTRLFEQGRDAEATSIACRVMRELPKKSPIGESSLVTSTERMAELAGFGDVNRARGCPIEPGLLGRAASVGRELADSQHTQVVIHGDLHHENILSSQRGWLVIDPHGVVAEPAFEVGALLRNPDGLASRWDLDEITRRRVDQVVEELGYERERIIGWAIAQAVLSAVWSIEDHEGGYDDALRIAESLGKLL